ncbi:DUF2953 domain-containing protein [Bacillus sp. CGMCC 1.16541]|uniref:DUF2953 domain-containing protein n=1 Tax=Bacillus sp. CGMCC 1.16541 TaxID=2185143 RepID=UPI000D726273|nr:DUF2953 domain-containing protein [Bacillus sp. CGMCC 1.16541]
MVWVISIVGLLVFFLLLIIFTKITILINVNHIKNNDYAKVTLSAWFGLIRYTYEIPVVEIQKDSPTVVVEEEKGAGDQGSEKNKAWKDYSVNDALDFLQDTEQFLKHVVGFHKIVRRFLKTVSVKEIKWHTRFGLGDAAYTGMAVGLGWTIKNGVIGIISQYMKLKDRPNMSITPVFQHMWSEVIIECIISFRIGHAILAGFRTFKYWRSAYEGKKEFFTQIKPRTKQKERSLKT